MDNFTDRCECGKCGHVLTGDEKSCPSCGSTRRKHFVTITNGLELRNSLSGLARMTDIKSVRNTTGHKLKETEHFLSMMKQTFQDNDMFAFNFSAFLSAARSITLHMKNQYNRCKGFAEWYCHEMIKMSGDPELQYLKKIRNEDIHVETIQTGATRETSFGVNVVFGEAPPKSEKAKETEKPPIQDSTKTSRRFLPKFGGIEVIKFCENQLDKFKKIVDECEKQFLASKC